ncbi:hypothetical protein A5707_13720 [Mycobacterium kyorinense]|uniref:SnoaL-like domain-containing protein n=1 Tax=Mycobacterium kyorinense TaxID=487514 RepID=A0A1A2ZPH7_9MYCO|nr:nuclear transport factor 2 family protein [Mycobacterium kyorinense]OBI51598.1 hypothetical protein A5707_13720 [Mycobacterium kyorinense]
MTLSPTDRAALADLVHRYAAGVDDRQFDSVTALFTDDAELAVPDPPAEMTPVRRHRGRVAIGAALATVATAARTEHAIVGEVYQQGPGEGSAHGRIACVAHHWLQRDEKITDLVWHLRYDDDYQRTDAGWRISRRQLTINAIEHRSMRSVRPADPAI